MIWMDVDIAIAEAPVNIMPLIDDTDFKSIEAAVVYNQAGMALIWHFVTTAGVMTETAVTPTTAGVHDWTDQGTSGLYALEIPASAGTINNDTEGFGWFTGVATGILPWRGPIIGFRAAALNNALIDGGDELDVNVTKVADTSQTANDNGADINAILVDTAEIGTAGVGLSNIPWNASWDAEVESEVNDALDTAISELGVAAPTATPTIRTGLMLLYMALRNKTVVQTSGTDALEIYNNAGTKIAAKLLTDDGSDYTEAEMS